MIGRTVTSIVKLISCKIILVISQRQAPFCQFNRTPAIFLLVILMVNMLSRIKSIRSCLFVCLTYLNLLYYSYLNQRGLLNKKMAIFVTIKLTAQPQSEANFCFIGGQN